jgi:hypothetical protein
MAGLPRRSAMVCTSPRRGGASFGFVRLMSVAARRPQEW